MGFPNILKFFKNHYVKTILIFFTIILIINLFLIWFGHFDAEPADGEEKFKRTTWNTVVDSVYFTTTQLSTIGYGDITAKTTTAKNVCSLVHVFIIIISLKLFSEIGFMSKADKDLLKVAQRTAKKDGITLATNEDAISSDRYSLSDDNIINIQNSTSLTNRKLRNIANMVINQQRE